MMASRQTLETQWVTHTEKFNELQRSFQRSCDAVPRLDDPSEREGAMETAKQKMHDLEDLLFDMKTDLRAFPATHKSSKALFTREWHSLNNKVATMKNDLKHSSSKHQWLSMESSTKQERQTLLSHQEMYENMRLKAIQSLRVLTETEEIGMNTTTVVHDQGQQLDKINADVTDLNDVSDRARRVIRNLKMKVYSDRFLQILIVVVEIFIIIFLLWWKLRKNF